MGHVLCSRRGLPVGERSRSGAPVGESGRVSNEVRRQGVEDEPGDLGLVGECARWYRGVNVFLVAVSVLLSACFQANGEDRLDEALIQRVERGDLVETVVESGQIVPWYEVQIKPKVSGEVKSVEVDEGDSVEKGQLLLTLVDIDYRRRVTLAKVAFEEARLNVANARSELERTQAAYEARGVSKYELDRAKYQLDLAKVRLERARVELATAKDQLGYTRIRSPIDGVVIERNIEPGEMVTAGITATVNGEPQLTIAQLDRLLLELNMNQVDVARVKIGQTATVVLDAYRDSPIEGEVTSIAAAAHRDVTKGIDVFKVEVTIDPGRWDIEIKPGMTAEVKVHVGTYEDVVKVPVETVFEEDGQSYLYVVKADPRDPKRKIKEKVQVKLGHRGMREVEIVEGLEPGQEIYAQGDTRDLKMKM